jgi:TPR repeat protein
MKNILLSICFMLVTVTSVPAQTLDELRSRAQSGDRNAMIELATTYHKGENPNVGEAVVWYSKLAEQGDVVAMTALGEIYAAGGGDVAANGRLASVYYRKAYGQAPEPDIANKIANLIAEGSEGVSQSYASAMAWYEKAAAHGDTYAMCQIGRIYLLGDGDVAKDPQKAEEWFQKAQTTADSYNDPTFTMATNILVRSAKRVEEQERQLSEPERLEKAAERGSGKAMLELGRMYEQGRGGVEKDLAQAQKWYGQAIAKGGLNAELARQHLAAANPAPSPPNSIDRLRRANLASGEWKDAEVMVSLDAMWKLANAAASASPVSPLERLKNRANAGDPDAMYELGKKLSVNVDIETFWQGTLMRPPRSTEAYRWFEKAANSGHAKAMVSLFYMNFYDLYDSGMDKAGRERVALSWLARARNTGLPEAVFFTALVDYNRLNLNTPAEANKVRSEALRFMQMVPSSHSFYSKAWDMAKNSGAILSQMESIEEMKRRDARAAEWAGVVTDAIGGTMQASADYLGARASANRSTGGSIGAALLGGLGESIAQGTGGRTQTPSSAESTGTGRWYVEFHPDYLRYCEGIYNSNTGLTAPRYIREGHTKNTNTFATQAQAETWLQQWKPRKSSSSGGLVVNEDDNFVKLWNTNSVGTVKQLP